jgi:hypothetical protein
MAQMQAEQELQMQLQQNPELALQIQQQELMNQQAMAQGQPPMPNVLLENLKAQAELTLTQELMPRLDAILQTGQGDAIAKLKAQELEIRAQENADDKEIAEKRLELDELNFAQLVQRAISKREEQIQEILLSGGIENHEQYQNLVGQVQALNFVKDEVRQLLKSYAEEENYE